MDEKLLGALQILGCVDTAVYGAPPSWITRLMVLEEFQAYGHSVLGKHGNGRPNVRDVVKTIKSFLEETLAAIPDSVLDSPVVKSLPSREAAFSNVQSLMPTPYKASEQEMLYA
ncbi:hypothetical protein Ancab_006598 [Ancistrocladus abbreviatus]